MPQEQPKDKDLNKEKPITFTWILLGIAAIIVMWLLSSLWFR